MIYYIIYETTNLVNNKLYRGAHVCDNLNDGYLGSGAKLRQAIRKYGRDKFSRQILFMAFDYNSMWEAEAIFVDQAWVDRPDTYNICLGGKGSPGFGKQHSQQTILTLSARAKARWKNPVYRAKNIESQKKRTHSEESRRKMSLAGKGVPNSPTTNKNISESLKKRFQDPAERKKRSQQSKSCNSRSEVRQKISAALTGIKRTDATKQKSSLAAKRRVQDPGYLAKQSVAQSKRWEENPAVWWNNGQSNKRSVESPGPEWSPGRISFGTWWNNGHSTKMSVECPGDGWLPGRRIAKPSH